MRGQFHRPSVGGRALPPPAIKTMRDLLYWQYAKIIAHSAGMGKRQWPFVMNRFKKLQSGTIAWDTIREYVKEREDLEHCLYCGRDADLTLDHLIPRVLGGPDDEKNAAWVCASCNTSKGIRRPYEHWTRLKGLRAAKYDVPRIAEGKYLKLLYELLGDAGLLELGTDDLRERVCPGCDLGQLCEEEGSSGKLSPLCLDGIAPMVLREAL